MGNKKTAVLLVIICAAFLLIAGKYIKDSGILKGYPDAEYLTTDESEYRPAYRGLTRKEKSVYTALYRGISEHEEDIPLPCELDGDEYSKLYCLLEKQESRFFYLDSVYYTADKVRNAKIVYRKIYDVEAKQKELDEAVRAVVSGADGLDGDEYKVRYINDLLVRKCRYVAGDDKEFAATSYGCIVEGEANCEGYAKAFDLLASELGLESVLITGVTDEGENHAWNQVRVGGEWYNIDVTWADTDVTGEMRHMYYLCSDEDFGKTHISDDTVLVPYKCDNDDRNYYVNSGLYAESVKDAEEIVRREISRGSTNIELRFAEQNIYDEFMAEYIQEQNIFELLSEAGYQMDSEVTLSLKENRQELCITLSLS